MLLSIMKRIRSNYHNLYFLKPAHPKLRKAIIANFNNETLKSICESALVDLRRNIPLSSCTKRNLRTYKNIIRKVANKTIPLDTKRRLYVSGGYSFYRCCLL